MKTNITLVTTATQIQQRKRLRFQKKNNKFLNMINPSSTAQSNTDDYGNYYMDQLCESFLSRSNKKVHSQFREHFLQSFQIVKFMESQDPPDYAKIASKKMFFPIKQKDQNKKTLIFDLDETLIHCAEVNETYDIVQTIENPETGSRVETFIKQRPGVKKVIAELSEYFEVMVFTAGHQHYADKIIDFLDPENKHIAYRLYRDNCIEVIDGLFTKDLRIVGQRKIQDIILVDNAIYSYFFNMDNGIPCLPYYEDPQDNQLQQLIPFLKKLANVKDVRPYIKKHFETNKHLNFTEIEGLADHYLSINTKYGSMLK